MAGTQVQRRRGTTTQHSTFTGAEGELTVDTTKDTVVVHDGSTAGGFPLLRQDLNNLADGAITAAKLASNAVETAKIANDAVTYAKVQNVSAASRALGRKTAGAGDIEELTLSELLDFIGSAAQGDILYRGASSWARLAAGTSGQFLKTLGSGANPAWDTVSSSATTLLGTLTTTSGTSQQLSGLTLTGYKHLFIYLNDLKNINSSAFLMMGQTTSDDVNCTSSWTLDTPGIFGVIKVDLNNGIFGFAGLISGNGTAYGGDSALSTSSTTITFAWSTNSAFSSGSIRIYGVT